MLFGSNLPFVDENTFERHQQGQQNEDHALPLSDYPEQDADCER